MALKFRIPSNRSLADGALYFYPDIFFHDFKETDYLAQWQAVSASNTSYLVVVDGHLKPAGWIRYYFEQFKGWLGFTNNCAVEKVQMAAKKLAYYGYLNGFNHSGILDTISEWNDEYQPNSDYLQNCAQPRADDISAALQKQLIEFYSDHGDKLDAMHEPGGCVVFGQSYRNERDLSMAVQLDIQDKDLIDSILPHFKDPSTILKGSKFSKCYIDSQFTAIRERFAKLKQPVPMYGLGGFVSFLTSGWGPHNPASLGQLLLQLRVQADETLRLFPESKVDYVNTLIELNLEIAKMFKGKVGPTSINAYKQALNYQRTFISDPANYNEFLSSCFIDDDGFFDILREASSEHVNLWAQDLARKRSEHYDESPDKKSLLAYRISQCDPNSIPVDDLSFHIDSCIKFKKFPLASKLVERLFEFDEEKALRYLEHNEQQFRDLVESNPKIKTACAAGYALKGNKALLSQSTQKELARQYYQKALALDAKTAIEKSPAYYFEHNEQQFRDLVESNPKIKTACAAEYALKGKKALLDTGFFNQSTQKELARQYHQNALELDAKTAVETSPAYYFKEYVDAEEWQKAFDLLQERVTKGLLIDMLPKDSLNRLAQYYISQASTCYDNATVAATVALTPEDSCRRSIEWMKKAIQVVNSDDNLMYLNSYKCRLAKILTKDEDPERVNEALDILKEIEQYPSRKQDRHLEGFKDLYIRIQDKKISFLLQGCLGASIVARSWGAEAEHKARCQHVLDDLLKHIDKQIRLLSDEEQNYQQLAKLYFIKGDCIDYFDLGCGDPRACFKKACELEKNQPFYFLRYGQLLTSSPEHKDSVDEKGKDLLESAGLTELDYAHWYEERWRLHDAKFHKIHMPAPQTPAVLEVQKPGWRLGFGW